MRHTRVANPGGTAVRLNTATVDGRVVADELVIEAGGLDLRDSTVGALDDPARALPAADGWVEPAGLVYRGVPGHRAAAAGLAAPDAGLRGPAVVTGGGRAAPCRSRW